MIEIIEGFEINKNDKSNRIINIDISDLNKKKRDINEWKGWRSNSSWKL